MSRIVTLIPAYQTDFLAELFVGLRTQTFQDFRVVVSDDSPDGAVTALIRSGALDALIRPLDLLVVPGPRRGAFQNLQHLLSNWGTLGQLVHVHLHDDVVYPDFYRAHVAAHAGDPVSASVSARWMLGHDGRPAGMFPLPSFIEEQPTRVTRVDAARLFSSTVPTCTNWLGECSNTVLSQHGVECARRGEIGGVSFYGLGDIGVLLDASRSAPIAFIRDHLSGFRCHPAQATAQTASFGLKCGYLGWIALALGAWRDQHIGPEAVVQSLSTILSQTAGRYHADPQMNEFFDIVEANSRSLPALDAAFRCWWAALLQSNDASRREAAVISEA